jgi:hypothetical protein
MKEKFRDKSFGNAIRIKLDETHYWEAVTQDVIRHCEEIVNEYIKQGIKLTLRQLYYQMVARGFIPNHDKVYDKLSVLLTDARYNGLIDWEAIEDRVRVPKMHAEWDNVLGLIKSAKYSYRLPRWADQPYYIELFTEKDALSSVLQPIADDWHIHFCVNRGYSSASAMYDLGKRIKERVEAGKRCIILYLGDHDPSGLDMLRDITERNTEFLTKGRDYTYPAFEVVPIALTTAQVRQYSPPPNPAKLTDPRAVWYIAKYGDKSWEVDALRPEVMIKLVNETIAKYVDMPKLRAVKQKEQQDIKSIEDFAKTLLGQDKRIGPPAAYMFDRDDLRTKVMLMKLIHDTIADYEDGSEPFFQCPICNKAESVEMEDVFQHIFDDHTEDEFNELMEFD